MDKFLGIERNTGFGISKLVENISTNPINLMPISSIVVTSNIVQG